VSINVTQKTAFYQFLCQRVPESFKLWPNKARFNEEGFSKLKGHFLIRALIKKEPLISTTYAV